MTMRSAPTVPDRGKNVSPSKAVSQSPRRSADIVEDIDRLLDEIDAPLEQQADLADFRQQPGQ